MELVLNKKHYNNNDSEKEDKKSIRNSPNVGSYSLINLLVMNFTVSAVMNTKEIRKIVVTQKMFKRMRIRSHNFTSIYCIVAIGIECQSGQFH